MKEKNNNNNQQKKEKAENKKMDRLEHKASSKCHYYFCVSRRRRRRKIVKMKNKESFSIFFFLLFFASVSRNSVFLQETQNQNYERNSKIRICFSCALFHFCWWFASLINLMFFASTQFWWESVCHLFRINVLFLVFFPTNSVCYYYIEWM